MPDFVYGDCEISISEVGGGDAMTAWRLLPSRSMRRPRHKVVFYRCASVCSCFRSAAAGRQAGAIAAGSGRTIRCRPLPLLPADKAAARPPKPAATTTRVDLEKVDRVVDMVGELVITQAMLDQRTAYPTTRGGLARSSTVRHHTRALQDA